MNRENVIPNGFETWMLFSGRTVSVHVTRRYLTTEDICPNCGSGIRITVAQTIDQRRVYRLECVRCEWVTDALPDPEGVD